MVNANFAMQSIHREKISIRMPVYLAVLIAGQIRQSEGAELVVLPTNSIERQKQAFKYSSIMIQ